MRQTHTSHPFTQVALIVAAIIAAFWIASFFPDLVLALILSVLAAFVLQPVVIFLESRAGLKRVPAILITFFTVGGSIVYLLILAVPVLFDRLMAIQQQISQFPFDSKLQEIAKDLEHSLPFVNAESLARSVHGLIESAANEAGSLLENSVGTLATLAIVPFVTYFILADGHRSYHSLIERVPNRYFEMTLNVLNKIQTQLVGYLKGWILDSMIIGILSIVGLTILGVNYAFVIGLIAGIANLVPYLGPIIGATLAILVSLTQVGNFGMILPIVIMSVIIRLIDDLAVQPLCFARSVDMHPLTVILLLLVGSQMLGIGGMLLAIPLATIIKVSAVETHWGLKNYRIAS
jgi:putative permease